MPLGDPVPLNANGVATLVTNSLPHGAITVTAEYAGDGRFLGTTNALVQVVNTPPTSSNSTASVMANQTLVLSVAKLLARASDADAGDTLTVVGAGPTSTNGPAGNVVLNASAGTIAYTPASGYAGPDSFTYTISDNYSGTVTPTVYVTVSSANARSPNISAPGPAAQWSLQRGLRRHTELALHHPVFADPNGPWTTTATPRPAPTACSSSETRVNGSTAGLLSHGLSLTTPPDPPSPLPPPPSPRLTP